MVWFKKKLKQQKGETLVEAIVSLMIISLAIGLLFTSIMASARINQANKEMDEKFNRELRIAETFMEEEGYPLKQIQILIDFESIEDKVLTATRYGGEDGAFAAYDYEAEVEQDE